MRPDDAAMLLTCEHATNHVPERWRALFESADEALTSHRGWDAGAIEMAEAMSHSFGVPLCSGEVTRLLVDLNRSISNHDLWSEYSRTLPVSDQQFILESYYYPYRERIRNEVARRIDEGRMVRHVSVHTFCPELHGVIRTCDVGLLYDPSRSGEEGYIMGIADAIKKVLPGLRVRRNEPYQGTDDGCTTWLRSEFPEHLYWGIELEFNQAMLLDRSGAWSKLKTCLCNCLAEFGG
jgi:predicted N-formylglutamate amidohydrolase